MHGLTRTTIGICTAAAVLAPGPRADDGGAAPSPAPIVSGAACRAACPALDAAGPGALVRVGGQNLAGTARIVFLGRRGSKDDVSAAPRRRGERFAEVVVPEGARTGPIAALSADGQASTPTRSPLILLPADGPKAPRPRAGGSPYVDTAVASSRVYFFGRGRARLRYLVRGAKPRALRIDLVRLADRRSVHHWLLPDAAPGLARSVSWDGTVHGRTAPAGRYEFRVAVGPSALARSAGAGAPPPADATRAGGFAFLAAIFPIRGRHSVSSGAGRFGAPRAGHRHEGQDTFAACGTPLVAAVGGRVRYAGYQGAAGNYLVIDAAGTGVDMVYDHLRSPAPVRTGQRVYTGQRIGEVGQTGDATACHLHFELWSAPGWYRGGRPFDPLPTLRAWDAVS